MCKERIDQVRGGAKQLPLLRSQGPFGVGEHRANRPQVGTGRYDGVAAVSGRTMSAFVTLVDPGGLQ